MNFVFKVSSTFISENYGDYKYDVARTDQSDKTSTQRLADLANYAAELPDGADDPALWHLLDRQTGPILGYALAGTMCNNPTDSPAFPVAVTHTSTAAAWLTFAHELGHNLGAPHPFVVDVSGHLTSPVQAGATTLTLSNAWGSVPVGDRPVSVGSSFLIGYVGSRQENCEVGAVNGNVITFACRTSPGKEFDAALQNPHASAAPITFTEKGIFRGIMDYGEKAVLQSDGTRPPAFNANGKTPYPGLTIKDTICNFLTKRMFSPACSGKVESVVIVCGDGHVTKGVETCECANGATSCAHCSNCQLEAGKQCSREITSHRGDCYCDEHGMRLACNGLCSPNGLCLSTHNCGLLTNDFAHHHSRVYEGWSTPRSWDPGPTIPYVLPHIFSARARMRAVNNTRETLPVDDQVCGYYQDVIQPTDKRQNDYENPCRVQCRNPQSNPPSCERIYWDNPGVYPNEDWGAFVKHSHRPISFRPDGANCMDVNGAMSTCKATPVRQCYGLFGKHDPVLPSIITWEDCDTPIPENNEDSYWAETVMKDELRYAEDSITCLEVACGNGRLDTGETCECKNGELSCAHCNNCQLAPGKECSRDSVVPDPHHQNGRDNRDVQLWLPSPPNRLPIERGRDWGLKTTYTAGGDCFCSADGMLQTCNGVCGPDGSCQTVTSCANPTSMGPSAPGHPLSDSLASKFYFSSTRDGSTRLFAPLPANKQVCGLDDSNGCKVVCADWRHDEGLECTRDFTLYANRETGYRPVTYLPDGAHCLDVNGAWSTCLATVDADFIDGTVKHHMTGLRIRYRNGIAEYCGPDPINPDLPVGSMRTYRNCSRLGIDWAIHSKTVNLKYTGISCLVVACGNGRMDTGETCECASGELSCDHCNNCQLADGKECSLKSVDYSATPLECLCSAGGMLQTCDGICGPRGTCQTDYHNCAALARLGPYYGPGDSDSCGISPDNSCKVVCSDGRPASESNCNRDFVRYLTSSLASSQPVTFMKEGTACLDVNGAWSTCAVEGSQHQSAISCLEVACGNRRVEYGEACDCADGTLSCADCNNCQLVAGKECSRDSADYYDPDRHCLCSDEGMLQTCDGICGPSGTCQTDYHNCASLARYAGQTEGGSCGINPDNSCKVVCSDQLPASESNCGTDFDRYLTSSDTSSRPVTFMKEGTACLDANGAWSTCTTEVTDNDTPDSSGQLGTEISISCLEVAYAECPLDHYRLGENVWHPSGSLNSCTPCDNSTCDMPGMERTGSCSGFNNGYSCTQIPTVHCGPRLIGSEHMAALQQDYVYYKPVGDLTPTARANVFALDAAIGGTSSITNETELMYRRVGSHPGVCNIICESIYFQFPEEYQSDGSPSGGDKSVLYRVGSNPGTCEFCSNMTIFSCPVTQQKAGLCGGMGRGRTRAGLETDNNFTCVDTPHVECPVGEYRVGSHPGSCQVCDTCDCGTGQERDSFCGMRLHEGSLVGTPTANDCSCRDIPLFNCGNGRIDSEDVSPVTPAETCDCANGELACDHCNNCQLAEGKECSLKSADYNATNRNCACSTDGMLLCHGVCDPSGACQTDIHACADIGRYPSETAGGFCGVAPDNDCKVVCSEGLPAELQSNCGRNFDRYLDPSGRPATFMKEGSPCLDVNGAWSACATDGGTISCLVVECGNLRVDYGEACECADGTLSCADCENCQLAEGKECSRDSTDYSSVDRHCLCSTEGMLQPCDGICGPDDSCQTDYHNCASLARYSFVSITEGGSCGVAPDNNCKVVCSDGIPAGRSNCGRNFDVYGDASGRPATFMKEDTSCLDVNGAWSMCKAEGGTTTGFPWSISCYVQCGDGHLDAGETCDCGNGEQTCAFCSNCQLEAGAQRANQITATFRMEFTSDPSTSQDFANIGAKSCEAFQGAHPGLFGEPECGRVEFIEEISAGKKCLASIVDLCVARSGQSGPIWVARRPCKTP